MRRAVGMIWIFVLAAVLTVQGAFAGATLCRESDGAVSLEWGADGECGSTAVTCLKDGMRETAEHCLQCIDVPLPSEIPAKSLVFSLSIPLGVPVVYTSDPVSASSTTRQVAALSTLSPAAYDGARTIRLLI